MMEIIQLPTNSSYKKYHMQFYCTEGFMNKRNYQ